jgi:hypothetical protein
VALSVLAMGGLGGAAVLTPYSEQDASAAASVRALSPQIFRRLPRGSESTIVERGENAAAVVMQGLLAQSIDRHRSLVDGWDSTGSRDGVVLVVLEGASVNSHLGQVVGTYRPPEATTRRGEGIEQDVVVWARDHGPIQLSRKGDLDLIDRVDGSRPALCIADLRRHPDQLLALPPSVVTDLYAQDEIATPPLPTELRSRLAGWLRALPVTVVRAPEDPSRQLSPGRLLISSSAC